MDKLEPLNEEKVARIIELRAIYLRQQGKKGSPTTLLAHKDWLAHEVCQHFARPRLEEKEVYQIIYDTKGIDKMINSPYKSLDITVEQEKKEALAIAKAIVAKFGKPSISRERLVEIMIKEDTKEWNIATFDRLADAILKEMGKGDS